MSLVVALLNWTGLLSLIANQMATTMKVLGLSGEAVLVLVSSILFNVYSAIAVIEMLSLSMREITILAIMTVVAHNLLLETTMMKKAGSSSTKIIMIRLGWALALGALLNFLLPPSELTEIAQGIEQTKRNFLSMLGTWGIVSLKLMMKILILVCLIMIVRRLMEEFKVTIFLSHLLGPLMRVFGLSEQSSFPWILVNVSGYANSAAVIKDRVNNGKLKPREADLFNHHASLSHSLFEDTILYLAFGVSLFWLIIPRLLAATIVVWVERIRQHRFRRSFKVGTL